MKGTALLLSVFLLTIAMNLSIIQAQTTTITELQHPSYAVAGGLDPLLVTATVSYTDAAPDYSLFVGIVDLDRTPLEVVPGIASSSPDMCINAPVLLAFCVLRPPTPSGVEHLEFKIGGLLGEPREPGYWNLNITAGLMTPDNVVVEGSVSSIPFGINLTPVILTVMVPASIVVTVDGVEQPPGPVQLPVAVGLHNVSVPEIAEINDETRLRFDHWSDGWIERNRTITVKPNGEFEAVYVTQFRLKISGQAMSATGAGWYDEGSEAMFSVSETESMSGILGLLGGYLKFQGWYEEGNLVSEDTDGKITMNEPHTLSVRWDADYTYPALSVTALFVALVLVVVAFRRRAATGAKEPDALPERERAVRVVGPRIGSRTRRGSRIPRSRTRRRTTR